MNESNFKNGIQVLEDKCKCGKNIRLHTHLFGAATDNAEFMFYLDCPNCGNVTDWQDSIDKCLACF